MSCEGKDRLNKQALFKFQLRTSSYLTTAHGNTMYIKINCSLIKTVSKSATILCLGDFKFRLEKYQKLKTHTSPSSNQKFQIWLSLYSLTFGLERQLLLEAPPMTCSRDCCFKTLCLGIGGRFSSYSCHFGSKNRDKKMGILSQSQVIFPQKALQFHLPNP